MSSPQNPLIQPTVGPDVSGSVSTELLQGLGEIVTEDTNNILVQVLFYIYNLNNLVLYYFCGRTLPCYLQARIFRTGVTWRSDVYVKHKHAILEESGGVLPEEIFLKTCDCF